MARQKTLLSAFTPVGLDWLCTQPNPQTWKAWSKATKMVFIRYPKHSKGYVIYGEHPNGGMTKVDSRNVDFLKDEFLSIGEIKTDLALYELPLDD